MLVLDKEGTSERLAVRLCYGVRLDIGHLHCMQCTSSACRLSAVDATHDSVDVDG